MSNQAPDFLPPINPANGLPMVEDTYVDIEGNLYGTDAFSPQWTPVAPYEQHYYPAPADDIW